MSTPEGAILSSIADYLTLKHHFFFRSNNIPVFDKTRGHFRSMPKYSKKGVPDIILIKAGTPYFLEVKRPKTYQSADQKTFEQEATAAGAVYAVLRSVDDAVALGL